MNYLIFALFGVLAQCGDAEVTVLTNDIAIYDRGPKLRIRGSGFDTDEHISLTLSASGEEPLKADKDFNVIKVEDGIILKLLSNRRWADMSGRASPVSLVLSSVTFTNNPNSNLLPAPVTVAKVLVAPEIVENTGFIYQSSQLTISGTGFVGATLITLYFEPPLLVDTAYEVVSQLPLTADNVVLRLHDGYKWRDDPGPLRVMSIDTGGGVLQLNGEEGVKVGDVHADVEDPSSSSSSSSNSVQVFPTRQRVYQSANQMPIEITGSGFREGVVFTFSPSLELNQDYTMTITSSTRATLILKGGKKWHKRGGQLMITAFTADGWTHRRGRGDGGGVRVAHVLVDPVLVTGDSIVHDTQSKVVVLHGSGFTNLDDLQLELLPTGAGDFKVMSVTVDTLRLQLKLDRHWLPPSFSHLQLLKSGGSTPLRIASIDTGAGKVAFDLPVTVGVIVKDLQGAVCDDSCEFAFDGVCDDGSGEESEDDDDDDDDYQGGDGNGSSYDTGRRRLGEGYDDNYVPDPQQQKVNPCLQGTDCTDCGGVDAIASVASPLLNNSNNNNINATSSTNSSEEEQSDDDYWDFSDQHDFMENGKEKQKVQPAGHSRDPKQKDVAYVLFAVAVVALGVLVALKYKGRSSANDWEIVSPDDDDDAEATGEQEMQGQRQRLFMI